MIQAADRADTKLMIAYRLHFEKANMNTVELAQSGKLGNLRLFNSVFTQQVREGDIRVEAELGGGSLYDIGVYCINAARYVFQANPTKVSAGSSGVDSPRACTLPSSSRRPATASCCAPAFRSKASACGSRRSKASRSGPSTTSGSARAVASASPPTTSASNRSRRSTSRGENAQELATPLPCYDMDRREAGVAQG